MKIFLCTDSSKAIEEVSGLIEEDFDEDFIWIFTIQYGSMFTINSNKFNTKAKTLFLQDQNKVTAVASITIIIHSPSTSKSTEFPIFTLSLQKYRIYQYP